MEEPLPGNEERRWQWHPAARAAREGRRGRRRARPPWLARKYSTRPVSLLSPLLLLRRLCCCIHSQSTPRGLPRLPTSFNCRSLHADLIVAAPCGFALLLGFAACWYPYRLRVKEHAAFGPHVQIANLGFGWNGHLEEFVYAYFDGLVRFANLGFQRILYSANFFLSMERIVPKRVCGCLF